MTHALSDLVERIPHHAFRKLTELALAKAPSTFWTAPASTSGKYHPADSLGKGGLVRHTRNVFRLTLDLLDMRGVSVNDTAYSIALSAALLHDTWKVMPDIEHSVFEHPILAALAANQLLPKFSEEITSREGLLLCNAIRSHMGRWTTSKYSSYTLPEPSSWIDILVHTADYLASRKHISLSPEA